MIVPPPFECQQRAFDCAFVLRAEWWACLPLADRVRVEVVYRTGPDGLGWHDLAAMFVLYGETVGARV